MSFLEPFFPENGRKSTNDKYCSIVFIWLKSTYSITFLNKPQTQTLGIFPLFWNLLASSNSNGAPDNNRSNLSSAGKKIPLASPNETFRYILQIQGCHEPSDLDTKAWRIKKDLFSRALRYIYLYKLKTKIGTNQW